MSSLSVNKVILIGNITQDIDFRTIPSGTAVAKLNVATNRSYKDKNNQLVTQAEYHRVVAWGKLAELCKEYLEKGRMVYVEGRLQTRSWQDQTGSKVSTTEVVAEIIRFGPKSGRSDSREAPLEQVQGTVNKPVETAGEDDSPSINLDELPY